jgi:hypothetical protein
LPTVFLLVAAIAVWLTYVVNRRHNTRLQARIAVLRPLARELVVDDDTRIAIVKLEEMWYDENRWEVYLPAGQYRLCVATREIDQRGLAPVVKSAPLGAGRHSISIEQQSSGTDWRVVATWDAAGKLTVDEPKEWDAGLGATTSVEFSQSTQVAPDQPVVLFRRIFSRTTGPGQSSTPSGPAEGILLWIEPVPRSDVRASKDGAHR